MSVQQTNDSKTYDLPSCDFFPQFIIPGITFLLCKFQIQSESAYPHNSYAIYINAHLA